MYFDTDPNSYRDRHGDRNTNGHQYTVANAPGNYIRHYFLLFESSPWPRAKCDPQPDWDWVGLDFVRWLR